MTRRKVDPARVWWKTLHRLRRVVAREQMKVMRDVMLFGSGVMVLPTDGSDPHYVPIGDIREGG